MLLSTLCLADGACRGRLSTRTALRTRCWTAVLTTIRRPAMCLPTPQVPPPTQAAAAVARRYTPWVAGSTHQPLRPHLHPFRRQTSSPTGRSGLDAETRSSGQNCLILTWLWQRPGITRNELGSHLPETSLTS